MSLNKGGNFQPFHYLKNVKCVIIFVDCDMDGVFDSKQCFVKQLNNVFLTT